MPSNGIAIRLENVTQRFRVIHERHDTVRGLFSKLFSQQSSYHDFDAVKNVSFEVPKGEMIVASGWTQRIRKKHAAETNRRRLPTDDRKDTNHGIPGAAHRIGRRLPP